MPTRTTPFHLGWKNEGTAESDKNTRLELYNSIKAKNGVAYVTDYRVNKAFVGTREHSNGAKYLQTYADGVWTDNLLALPECK